MALRIVENASCKKSNADTDTAGIRVDRPDDMIVNSEKDHQPRTSFLRSSFCAIVYTISSLLASSMMQPGATFFDIIIRVIYRLVSPHHNF